MTQEEKAKRYDEAIKKAKSKIKNDKDHVLYEDDIIEIFPELKESEDEMIRKALIDGFKRYDDGGLFNGCLVREILAWLEKQGKQKPTWSEEDETRLTNTIIMLKEGASLHFNKKDITKTVDWLKSLKDRYSWKPVL